MIVKTYYSTGRPDVFDTTAMADATVIPGNLMANWTLRLKDLDEEQALWMTMFWYEAVPLEKTAEYAGLPIARLREGWSFVLVDIDEISHLERVEVDGKTALVRQGGYLMDCVSLDAAADRGLRLLPRLRRRRRPQGDAQEGMRAHRLQGGRVRDDLAGAAQGIEGGGIS